MDDLVFPWICSRRAGEGSGGVFSKKRESLQIFTGKRNPKWISG
jgi:hypothetical protein